jgi:prophage regulatory protein
MIEPSQTDTPDRLIDRRAVLERVPVSAETLHRWIRDGRFPAPIKLAGLRRLAWRECDVAAWIRGSAS